MACALADNDVWQAVSGLAVAIFTFTLWWSTHKMWRSSERQAALALHSINLARDEFIASHRPRLRVRRVTPTRWQAEKFIEGRMEVANIGDTEAILCQIGVCVFVEGTGFNAVPKPISPIITVPPGKEAQIDFVSGCALTISAMASTDSGVDRLNILAIINYRDRSGVVRATSIFRTYHCRLKRFVDVAIDDPEADRNYED